MAAAVDARNQEAIHHNLAFTDFLELLIEDELNRRRDRLFARRLKQSHIPGVKELESFDWSFNPRLPKPLILDLSTTRFVGEHAGVLLLGLPGTGKSHIAISCQMSADAGCFSSDAVSNLTALGMDVYMPPDKLGHRFTLLPAPRGRIPQCLSIADRMRRKLRTKKGKVCYGLRKELPEPVFGQIKQVRGFDHFLLRGLENVSSEWKVIF
jgi:hypothetical protein